MQYAALPAIAMLWAIAGAGIAIAAPGALVDFASSAQRLIEHQPVSLVNIASWLIALGAASWAGAAYALRHDE